MRPVIVINSKEKEEKSNGYGTVRETTPAQENNNEGGKSKFSTAEQGLVEDV